MTNREDKDMLYIHCKEDSRYLMFVLDDYLRIKKDYDTLVSQVEATMKESRQIMRALWTERSAKVMEELKNDLDTSE